MPVDIDGPTPAPHALELSRVVKSFGAVVALRSGTITLDEGSIHALIGENGAGKSTLVKIIAGLYRRDAGEFRLAGEPVDFHTTAQSKAAGHRRHLPGADALPRSLGDREHLHGPAAHEPLRSHRSPRDAIGGAARSSPGSASRSIPTASPRASRSPTSRSSRSRRPSRSTPGCSSWTSRRPP